MSFVSIHFVCPFSISTGYATTHAVSNILKLSRMEDHVPALLVFQDSKPILVALSWTGLETPMVTDDASGLLPYYSFFEIETKVLIWILFATPLGCCGSVWMMFLSLCSQTRPNWPTILPDSASLEQRGG